MIKVLNLKAFVITDDGILGFADGATFASAGWLISDEFFDTVRGEKFSWIASDGKSYCDFKGIFSRPTEEQVIVGLTPQLKEKALEAKLIELGK